MHASVRTLPGLALGVAVPTAVLIGALALPAQAAPAASAPTAQQLLVKIARSGGAHYSGTVTQTSQLGLPELPAAGPGSASTDESGIVDLVTAPHTAKVYVDGSTKQRVQVLDQLAERDVVHNGSSVWIWDSKQKTAEHVTLPSKTADPHDAETPADIAQRLLAAAGPSTTVTVATGSASVAGRPVDRLVLTPTTGQTLVSRVVVSVDHATGVPLKVVVDARGASGDAVSVGFTDVSFSKPDASLFAFTPPKGAKVTTKDLSSASADRAHPSATAAPHPTVTGSGWASVVSLPVGTLPAQLTSNPLYGELTTAVAGGRALQTSLVSVLVTDDGRVLAGAVPVSALQSAAAR